MTVVFEDLHEFDGRCDYAVVNEKVSLWRELLEGITVKRAASVCSGGEVSFFAILPHVEEELCLIDHSYVSMYYAIGKYHLIQKCGPEAAYELLAANNVEELKPIFDEANAELPTMPNRYKGESKAHYETKAAKSFCGTWIDVEFVYQDIGAEALTEFLTCKDRLKFWHGDLNDLVERGPFELVYLSNALEYSGRDGNRFKIDDMVAPGGYLLASGSAYRIHDPQFAQWEEIANTTGQVEGTDYGYNAGNGWRYRVLRKPE